MIQMATPQCTHPSNVMNLMNHFPRFASVESAALRYALIVAHLPVIAFALAIHAVGGVVTHGHNFINGVLNAASGSGQGYFNHLIAGIEIVVGQVRHVAAGPGPKHPEPQQQAQPAKRPVCPAP